LAAQLIALGLVDQYRLMVELIPARRRQTVVSRRQHGTCARVDIGDDHRYRHPDLRLPACRPLIER